MRNKKGKDCIDEMCDEMVDDTSDADPRDDSHRSIGKKGEKKDVHSFKKIIMIVLGLLFLPFSIVAAAWKSRNSDRRMSKSEMIASFIFAIMILIVCVWVFYFAASSMPPGWEP